jgi:hypothetical protein
MKENSGGNKGLYMAGRAQAGADEGQSRAGIRQQYDQLNINPYNQLALPTAQLATQRAIDRQNDVTSNRDFLTHNVGELGSKASSATRDYNSTAQDKKTLEWLKKMYPKVYAEYTA